MFYVGVEFVVINEIFRISSLKICNIKIQKYDQDTWNVHNVHTRIGIRKTRNWFRYETFYYLFEFKVFPHEERERERERERENFFLCRLFHLSPTTCGTPAANYWSPRWAPKIDLLRPTSNLNPQLTQPTRGARSAQNRLASPRSESQLYERAGIP